MSRESLNTPSIFSVSYKTVFQHYPRNVQKVTQMINIQDVHKQLFQQNYVLFPVIVSNGKGHWLIVTFVPGREDIFFLLTPIEKFIHKLNEHLCQYIYTRDNQTTHFKLLQNGKLIGNIFQMDSSILNGLKNWRIFCGLDGEFILFF